LPIFFPQELDEGRSSEVLLSLQRNNLNPTGKEERIEFTERASPFTKVVDVFCLGINS